MAQSSYPKGEHRQGFRYLSVKQAAAIGYVAAHWSDVEAQIIRILGHLIDPHTPAVGWAVSVEMTFLQRIAAVRTLLEESRDFDLVEAWDAIKDRLDFLRGKRNDVIHSMWSGGTPPVYMRYKARGRIRITIGSIDIDDLHRLSEDTLKAYDLLCDFQDNLRERRAFEIIRTQSAKPHRDPGLSRKARALEEARAQKRARRAADRERSRAKVPSHDSDPDGA
jgi:hypothetical protein